MNFSQHFTYRRLLRYAFPPVIMMIFTSLYSVVDGLFLSNYTGTEAFAAVNFIIPYLMMFTSTGFMFGTGGSALIAKKLGEQKQRDADEIFSTLMWVSLMTGTVLAAIGYLLLKPVALLQGADGPLLKYSLQYGRIYLLGTPACIVQFEFQNLYSTAGKNKLGLYATVLSGLMNIVPDGLFLGAFSWGITGAAAATVVSQVTGGLIPFVYFGRKNTSLLRMVRCRLRGKDMLKICLNGSSEMVSNISISLVSLLYNMQLLAYAGDRGIAAYGIMMYVNFLFTAVFWGYTSGAAPIISFHYGAENHRELHSLLKKSLMIIFIASAAMFLLSVAAARPVSSFFVSYDPALLEMTVRGFYLFSLNFLFEGLSIFGSAFFTALNNGPVSAGLSFARIFVFQVPAVLLLPLLWKLDGIWLSAVAANFLAALLSAAFVLAYRKKYQY